jgi:hypothetical protein
MMTLVIARQWGDRIIMLSDTMVSYYTKPRPDIIPGHLKVIVLTHKLSIAYAGDVDKALDTIRKTWRMACQGTNLLEVLEYLRQVTSSGDVEFLVASHHEDPVLCKIRSGERAIGANQYWIGDPSAIPAIQRATEAQPIPEFGEWGEDEKEEARLRSAFTEVIRESTFLGVGGFSFHLLGSPLGHCYQDDTGYFSWDTVKISEIDTPEYRRFQKTGTAHYQYNTIAPQQRGAGIAGAFLPQAELGFIYSPLQCDSVLHRSGVTLQDLSAEVNQIATDLICPSEK